MERTNQQRFTDAVKAIKDLKEDCKNLSTIARFSGMTTGIEIQLTNKVKLINILEQEIESLGFFQLIG